MIIGLDPSFSNTGIALISTTKKKVVFSSVGSKIGEKTFSNIVNNVDCRVNLIIGELLTDLPGAYILTETPPAMGSFSSGLFALDTHLIISLKQFPIKSIEGLSPVYLSHVHGTRKYTKTDSVTLCKSLITVFENNGYDIDIHGRLSNDMAEAFIFAVRKYVSLNNELVSELLKVAPNLYDKREFYL